MKATTAKPPPAPVRELTERQRLVSNLPPLQPLTVDQEDKLVVRLKSEPKGSRVFCETLADAPPRLIIRAAKECVLSPATTVVNRTRVAFLLDHVVKVLGQTPRMELNGEGDAP